MTSMGRRLRAPAKNRRQRPGCRLAVLGSLLAPDIQTEHLTHGMATRRHKNARRHRQACSKITHCVFLCFLAFFAAVCCLLRESRFHFELSLVIARTGRGAISTPHQRRPVGCRPRPTSRSRRTRKAIPKSPKLLRCSSVKMTVCATQHVLVQVPNRSHRRPPRRTHALHPGPMPSHRGP